MVIVIVALVIDRWLQQHQRVSTSTSSLHSVHSLFALVFSMLVIDHSNETLTSLPNTSHMVEEEIIINVCQVMPTPLVIASYLLHREETIPGLFLYWKAQCQPSSLFSVKDAEELLKQQLLQEGSSLMNHSSIATQLVQLTLQKL